MHQGLKRAGEMREGEGEEPGTLGGPRPIVECLVRKPGGTRSRFQDKRESKETARVPGQANAYCQSSFPRVH